MENDFDVQNIIDYWIESSDADYKTMLDLFHTKNYGWALFAHWNILQNGLKTLKRFNYG